MALQSVTQWRFAYLFHIATVTRRYDSCNGKSLGKGDHIVDDVLVKFGNLGSCIYFGSSHCTAVYTDTFVLILCC
jgi:hypothetical protein